MLLAAAAAAASAAQEAQAHRRAQVGRDAEGEGRRLPRSWPASPPSKAVPTLAALLGDEKLSHMARYALEPIPDPSVDDALRDALGKLKGRPLVGVIGSLGVRRDAKAVAAMAKLLADPDADVAQAAARALGKIGTPEAAKALDAALAGASAANQVAFCEGLFRCAEALSAQGQAPSRRRSTTACAACRRRRSRSARRPCAAPSSPGRKEGIPLMLEAIRGADYVLTAAAARTAMELPGPEVTAALAGELPKLPADKQILLVNTLGYRGDASAGPALLALASKGPDGRPPGRHPQPHAPGLRARPAAAGRAVARGRGRAWPPPRGPAWAASPARTPTPRSWPCSPTRTPRSAAWPSR